MESSEHSPEQPHIQNELVDKAKTGLVKPLEQIARPRDPSSIQYVPKVVPHEKKKIQPAAVGEVSKALDRLGLSNRQVGQSQDVFHQKGVDQSKRGAKDFVWMEDLTENGRKLYLLLLGEIGYTDKLPEYAKYE